MAVPRADASETETSQAETSQPAADEADKKKKTTTGEDSQPATGTADTDATTVVVEPTGETRFMELALLVIGAAVLLFAGFVAAGWGLRSLGSTASTAMTSVGPVTNVGVSSVGTTITQVTTSAIKTTSSHTSSSTSSDSWLGVVLGAGALIIIAGAFYRRSLSFEGYGLKVAVKGVVSDPLKDKAITAVAKDPTIPPEQAPRVVDRVLERAAEEQVQVEKVQEPRPAAKGVRGHLKRLRRRPKSQLVLNVRGRPIADETLDSWVDEAKAEVAGDWGKT